MATTFGRIEGDDLADIPVGMAGRRWPADDGPIEASSGELLFRLNHSRLQRTLPQSSVLSIRCGSEWLWTNVPVSPAAFLEKIAVQWRQLLALDARIALGGQRNTPSHPQLAFERNGMEALVRLNGSVATVVDAGDLVATLEIFCNALAARLPLDASEAKRWYDRLPKDRLAEIEARESGIPVAELDALGIGVPANANELIFPNDVRLAARLTGGSVPVDSLRSVFDVIRGIHGDCAKIDRLADEFDVECRPEMDVEPLWYEKGFRIARWLRAKLGLSPEDRLDIEAILKDLDVNIRQVDMGVQKIDAIAAWGDHGPVVVVNTSGERAHDRPGRRNTLAHELCHLVVDRYGALPSAEVKGDDKVVKTNERIEQRANACAAELLLPQDYALRYMSGREDVEDAVEELCGKFDVSMMIVLHHLQNGVGRPGGPTEDQQKKIGKMLNRVTAALQGGRKKRG